MYLSIRKFSNVKSPDVVIKTVQTQLLPVITALPGFVAYYATKFEGGDLGAVSIFDKKENADNASERAMKWIKENLAEQLPSEPMTLRGEVAFNHTVPHTAAKTA